MKRLIICLLAVFMLFGCHSGDDIKPALDLRSKLQKAEGCSFDVVITADYGEAIYTFTMHCNTDKNGQLQFKVLKPDSISGIDGVVSGDEGSLTFDDKVLAFDTLADGYITPVLAPWVMMNGLKSGYIISCGKADDGYRISLNDSYKDDALQMDVWTDISGAPIQCEILYKERRCLTLEVKNFTYV